MAKGIFSRDAILVLAACFCFMACHTMIIPVLAGFTGSLGGSGLLMGTIVGITNLVSIGFRIVSGPIADRVPKKSLSLSGAVMMGIGCTACALTQGTGLLLAARIVHGIGFACCSLGLSTWFSMLLPREKLGSGMGIYGTVQAVALAVAPSMGISLERWLGYRPVFWGAVISALMIIMLSLAVRNRGKRAESQAATENKPEGKRKFRIVETGVIPIALVCMRMGFRNYFDKVPYRRFLAICTASAVVSMLLLDFAGHNLSLIGAAVCMAGGFGIICSESQATAMAMVDNTRRSLANNTYLIGLDSGMALGPMIGGFLYGHVAAQYFYPCLMTTAVLSTTVYFIWKKNVSYSGT